MIVIADIEIDSGDDRPQVGAPVIVEVRDTSAADGDSITLATTMTRVEGRATSWVATVELDIDDDAVPAGADLTAWARIAATSTPEVVRGDWITVQAIPVDPARNEQRVTVPVRHLA
jgi:hypothetical protein